MTQSTPVYEFSGFTLNPAERLLTRAGRAVALTPKAFDLLIVLVEERGRLLTKDILLKRVWPDSFVEEANLSHHVYKLREALGDGDDGNRLIETVPRRGYRFVGEVVEQRPVLRAPLTSTPVLPVEVIATEETTARIVIERRHDQGAPKPVSRSATPACDRSSSCRSSRLPRRAATRPSSSA
jgi:DNA-binding winged helix-turn-helix (wHTH) protein